MRVTAYVPSRPTGELPGWLLWGIRPDLSRSWTTLGGTTIQLTRRWGPLRCQYAVYFNGRLTHIRTCWHRHGLTVWRELLELLDAPVEPPRLVEPLEGWEHR